MASWLAHWPHRHAQYFEDLPLALPDELLAACQRLAIDDLTRALRHRIVPIAWSYSETSYVVCDAAAFERLTAQGERVLARAAPQELTDAIEQAFGPELMDVAVNHLGDTRPEFSAKYRFSFLQKALLSISLALMIFGSVFWPHGINQVAAIVLTGAFLGMIGLRGLSCLKLPVPYLRRPRALAEDDLPVYSVLVPLYQEGTIVHQLVEALMALDYPRDKLDIKLLLEEDDVETRDALAQIDLPSAIQVLTPPSGHPRTKPRALNYGLQFARGELLTVYDAEDVPEPRQLLTAAEIFAANPASLVCLQSRLTYYNAGQNWLTRQFTIEYGILFDLLLPFLSSLRLPLTLGGTSNHFRTANLRQVGGWDPYNVTEDADLGIRMARLGYQVGSMPSTTHEEAASRLRPWILQRARWIKGWTQTYLVHMRHPVKLYRDLGGRGFLSYQLLLGCTLLSALGHPVFITLTGIALVSGTFLYETDSLLVHIAGGISFMVLLAGYAVMMLSGFLALRRRRRQHLFPALLAMPVYWLLISMAAWLALWQFIWAPHHWNKTPHGQASLKGGFEE